MKLGIDLIDEHLNYFSGKRVGLITNTTGVNSQLKSTINILKEKTNLVALFAPEHGVRGNFQAGERFISYVDEETGVTVYSLYSENRKPSKEMMDQIDILCIDIQEVGSRFYTYIYTTAYAMQACKEYNKAFVVFDRPNPINGVDVEGNILDLNYRSFIGYYPIVQRYGMTLGELAMMYNEEDNIHCQLKVIPMKGWKRKMYYEDTHLPWVYPSPNLPTIDSTLVYNATCIFEGTNISEGRGTATPFLLIGAPFIKPHELAQALNNCHLDGVLFRAQYFTPTFSKHAGTLCAGVYIHVLDRHLFKPVKTGWTILETMRKMYPQDLKILPPYRENRPCMLELNTGCDYVKKQTYSLQELYFILEQDTQKFKLTRKKYLIY
ncbi:MAG: exo-beta-N-acetylmuramidase NamZ domain-containing protein [Bacilli bacterium]